MSSGVAPGELLAGRYRLQHALGQGGMGIVYQALDLAESTAAPVAIKLLSFVHPEAAASPEHVERFEREVRAARLIAHEGVVKVLDSGEHGGVRFLVMERLQGVDLRTALGRDGPLSVPDALRLSAQLCDVLEAAHAVGVVHRDLKPANVFLVGGVPGVPKVLDFGVAKWLHAGLALTGPSQMLGTPAFMAPELLMTARDATPAADVYAIGATLFAMLAVRPPFFSKSEVELQMMVAHDPAPALSSLRADVPRELDALLQRVLAKSAGARPASAAELRAALRAIERA